MTWSGTLSTLASALATAGADSSLNLKVKTIRQGEGPVGTTPTVAYWYTGDTPWISAGDLNAHEGVTVRAYWAIADLSAAQTAKLDVDVRNLKSAILCAVAADETMGGNCSGVWWEGVTVSAGWIRESEAGPQIRTLTIQLWFDMTELQDRSD